MDEKVDWSELPPELWPKIGKFLENHIDILRFRSVCKLFRSSIPSCNPSSPSFPMKIPHPLYHSFETIIKQATIYLIEPTDEGSNSKLKPLKPSSKGWLVKVKECKNKPLNLLTPISDRKITNPFGSSVISWNLMDYRVIEVCKSYTIQKNSGVSNVVNKVVFFPNSPWIDVENSACCCLFLEGKLGFMKHVDEIWRLVDYKNFFYDDVIVFKGQFYVTDRWGTISWIDSSSLKLIQFSPPLCGFGNKKHLVESYGNLYVVDRFYENEPRGRNHLGRFDREAAVEYFRVHKLDEEWGTWVDVKDLKDRAFVLGNSCNFSVSAKGLTGYKGNCIYFTDIFGCRSYNLEDHSILPIGFDPCIDMSLWSHDQSWRTGGHNQFLNLV